MAAETCGRARRPETAELFSPRSFFFHGGERKRRGRAELPLPPRVQVVAIVGGVGTRQESETDRRAHGISVVDSWLAYAKNDTDAAVFSFVMMILVGRWI